jgi:hypothetical protein
VSAGSSPDLAGDDATMSVSQLRALALSLPGMVESAHHGSPDFRLDNKIVVNLDEAASRITIKLSLNDQMAAMERDDGAFSLPGGWAKFGWTTVHMDVAGHDEVEEIVIDAWRRMAPRKLVLELDARYATGSGEGTSASPDS